MDSLSPFAMGKQSREQFEEFLAELAAPLGPEVFSGHGSELQNLRSQWAKEGKVASGNKIDGALHALAKEQAFIDRWVQGQDAVSTLGLLLEIARNPPKEGLHGGIARRRKTDWDYHLAELIYKLGVREPAALFSKLEANRAHPNAACIVKMVEAYLEEGP